MISTKNEDQSTERRLDRSAIVDLILFVADEIDSISVDMEKLGMAFHEHRISIYDFRKKTDGMSKSSKHRILDHVFSEDLIFEDVIKAIDTRDFIRYFEQTKGWSFGGSWAYFRGEKAAKINSQFLNFSFKKRLVSTILENSGCTKTTVLMRLLGL